MTIPNGIKGDEPFTASVRVTNRGDVATSEVVQLYARNNNSSYGASAPKKKLVAFEKVFLSPGETKDVLLQVDPRSFAVWDVNRNEEIIEQGVYDFMIGSSSADADVLDSKTVRIDGQAIATLALTQPVNVFDHAFASNEVVYHEVSKERTAIQLKSGAIVGGYYAVRSKQNGSWVALPKADLTGVQKVKASVATNARGGTITLHADAPDSEPLAVWNVPVTTPVSYTISNADVKVTELGYVDVEADIVAFTSGVHDLYVVFHEPDLRMDTISFTLKQTGPNPETPGTNPGSPHSPGSGSSNGNTNAEPSIPTVPEVPTDEGSEELPVVKVESGGPTDWEKAAGIRANGVQVIGDSWHVTVKGKKDTFAIALLPFKDSGAVIPTTIAFVGAGSKLTPVPSVLTKDENGNQAWKVMLNQEGTYVAIHSLRQFVDVPSLAWYADDVAKASSMLLINGVSERRMQPQGRTTSAQTLMAALNAIGIEPKAEETDVKWYDSVLRTAVEYGLMKEGQYAPNDPMSREDMASVLVRALTVAGVDTSLPEPEAESWLSDFRDHEQLQQANRKAMATAIRLGIFQGTPDHALQPQSTLTRAQLAAVIVRVREQISAEILRR